MITVTSLRSRESNGLVFVAIADILDVSEIAQAQTRLCASALKDHPVSVGSLTPFGMLVFK